MHDAGELAESPQPTPVLAPHQRRKAWSGHKEREEEGKKNNCQIKEKEKKRFYKSQLSEGCTWIKTNSAHLHETIVQPLSSASPNHSGATCHSLSFQTPCSALHLRQEILPGEEERHQNPGGVLPQALGYKFQTSIMPGRYAGARRKVTAALVKKSVSSSAALPPGPAGDMKRLPGACCYGVASCKEIRGSQQPGEAAGAGRL